ncbi:MAG TPA: hypothetical protein VG797_07330, partial [Phycisphaerales bacterium]|nr:hypothetical protein [Phycisphaerales bacterium]
RRRDDPATADTGVGPPPVVDAGAHEFQAPCTGDANGDQMIGLADIAAVIQFWGTQVTPAGIGPDVDGSGMVGLGDIAIVIQHWAEVCL